MFYEFNIKLNKKNWSTKRVNVQIIKYKIIKCDKRIEK